MKSAKVSGVSSALVAKSMSDWLKVIIAATTESASGRSRNAR
jgi:hypothetical protein